MAKVDTFGSVGIFVKDQKRALNFYTKTLGLKLLGGMPGFGYVELGAKKGSKDALLNLWSAKDWGLSPAQAKKKVGVVTGLGFGTSNLEATVASLKKKGVKVETWEEQEGYKMATAFDPDGNSFFLTGPARPRSKKAGITGLEWVTISSRNSKKAGKFFQSALGMRKEGDASWPFYRLPRSGTALMPFTPKRSMYTKASDYKSDLAAIGEETAIMFETKDIYGLEKKLLSKGVKFRSRAKEQDWGGISADIYDPDKNIYMIYQPSRR